MLTMRIIAVLALVTLQGCADCLAIGAFGFKVTIQDNTTQRAPKTPVTATVTDGDYVGVLSPHSNDDPPVFYGAEEREGRYQLRIVAPDYQTFVRENLHVRRSGSCGYLQTIEMTVNLIPIS